MADPFVSLPYSVVATVDGNTGIAALRSLSIWAYTESGTACTILYISEVAIGTVVRGIFLNSLTSSK